jgi:hypothetical protein
VAQIETDVQSLKNNLELREKAFQEQAQVLVTQAEMISQLKGCVKDMMVKLGAEVPEWLMADTPIPTSLISAPTGSETDKNPE